MRLASVSSSSSIICNVTYKNSLVSGNWFYNLKLQIGLGNRAVTKTIGFLSCLSWAAPLQITFPDWHSMLAFKDVPTDSIEYYYNKCARPLRDVYFIESSIKQDLFTSFLFFFFFSRDKEDLVTRGEEKGERERILWCCSFDRWMKTKYSTDRTFFSHRDFIAFHLRPAWNNTFQSSFFSLEKCCMDRNDSEGFAI